MATDEDGDEVEHTISDAAPNTVSDKNSDTDNHYSNKQGASSIVSPTRLQQREASTREITDDNSDNSADVVSLDTFRKKPT